MRGITPKTKSQIQYGEKMTKRFTMSEDNFIEDNSKIISVMSREEILFELNHLNNENEQLKQRNKNQYEQLSQLWKLIENEDYNTLRSMLNQLEEDEEQLRKEWGTYGWWND